RADRHPWRELDRKTFAACGRLGCAAMDTWDINALDVQPHQPQVLRSDDDARVVVINLPAGEHLQEHQVHEHAYLVVTDGEVELEQGGETHNSGPGTLTHLVPQERHEVRAS